MSEPNPLGLELFKRELAGHTPQQLLEFLSAIIDNEDAAADALASWKIRGAADALAPHEPLRYLVDQLLPYPALAIVYGGPGSYKSMLLADLAVCVAGGKRWLEGLPEDSAPPGVTLATEAHPVLWIDMDNGPRRTAQRFGAILRAHELDESTPLYHVSMPAPAVDASSGSFMATLTEHIKAREYRLVIIDNLGLITGNVEENSAAMASVMGRLRSLAEDAECALIVVHHQRKSAAMGDANGIRKGESLRGHSSIEAALDLALLVERKLGSDSISIIPTKVRDFLPFVVIGARFAYDHFEGTRDLERARFYSTVTETPEQQAENYLRATILEEVKAAPGIGQRDLVSVVRDVIAARSDARNVGVNTVRGTIKKMVEDGVLKCTGSTQAYRFYLP